MAQLRVVDLAAVVYSAGKVFDGLATGRLDTAEFLRSGSLRGVRSRADIALLEDLRDAAQFVIDHRGRPVDAAYVRGVNACITRSGAIRPGEYRSEEDRIGVDTPFGRHEPRALDDDGLQAIVDGTMRQPDPRERALELFVGIAGAQPFMDGNKRTAIFVANGVLLRGPRPELLTVPVDERSPETARCFNELLARAYLFGEHEGVKRMMRTSGFAPLGGDEPGRDDERGGPER